MRRPVPILLTALVAVFLLSAGLSGCSDKSAGAQHELTPEEQHGQRLFTAVCAVCHRADSTDPLNGPALKGIFKREYMPASGLKVSEQQVRETIMHGRKNMPPLGGVMNDQQLNDIIAYLKTL